MHRKVIAEKHYLYLSETDLNTYTSSPAASSFPCKVGADAETSFLLSTEFRGAGAGLGSSRDAVDGCPMEGRVYSTVTHCASWPPASPTLKQNKSPSLLLKASGSSVKVINGFPG